MSERYLLLVHREQALVGSRSRPLAARLGLQFVREHPAATLFTEEDEFASDQVGGWILGHLHDRAGEAAVARHGVGLLREEDFAPAFIERFWGDYVAIGLTGSGTRILRAPVGNLPCLRTNSEHGWLFASDPTILAAALGVSPGVDWLDVARQHYLRDLPTERTALIGVDEVLPGSEVRIEDGRIRSRQVWSPWSYAGDGDGMRCTAGIRTLVDGATRALSRGRARSLLSSSGGLDSAVVAASLAAAERPFDCLNMTFGSGLGDETEHAAAVSRATGSDLFVRESFTEDIDLDLSVAAHLPRPSGRIHEMAHHRALWRLAKDRGCDCVMTGNGGDNVFYNTRSARPFVDSLAAGRSWVSTARTCADTARLTGTSVITVLREAARLWRTSGSGYSWRRTGDLLSDEVLCVLGQDDAFHPWLEAPAWSRPGRAGHVAMLLRMQNHLLGFDRALSLPVVNPLASQPVVEAFLGISTWSLIKGGVDRAPVRSAFRSELPASVVDRTTKGSPEGFVLRLLRTRRAEIGARLLDGALVRHHIVARDELERRLRSGWPRSGSDVAFVMALLDTEAWIAGWTPRRPVPSPDQEGRP